MYIMSLMVVDCSISSPGPNTPVMHRSVQCIPDMYRAFMVELWLCLMGIMGQALRMKLTVVELRMMSVPQFLLHQRCVTTYDAAAFHSQRTYLQVQTWLGNDIPPEAWGWTISANGLVPTKMSQPAAPEKLLKIIRCNCGGQCNKKSCTCHKNGLVCTPACGQC